MDGEIGYFWDERLSGHAVGPTCPEVPDRCRVLAPQALAAEAGIEIRSIPFEARGSIILRAVHDAAYIEEVRRAHEQGRRYLDAGETKVTSDLYSQALLSASAGCEALDRIMAGELAAAFCGVRPPGHHANRSRALGFCVFNNVAVAARYARERYGVGTVLIVDWDVHPGNGTQEIFYEDPAVFTLSIHQSDLFEEAGRRELVGRGAGEGFNRNEPVPAGLPADEYVDIFARAVRDVTAGFRPELLLISAGFDAHQHDPSGGMRLQHGHFATMTEILLRAAHPFTGGRTLSMLEGGYNLGALRRSVAAHVKAMATGAPTG